MASTLISGKRVRVGLHIRIAIAIVIVITDVITSTLIGIGTIAFTIHNNNLCKYHN
jgi:hypothetical protein